MVGPVDSGEVVGWGGWGGVGCRPPVGVEGRDGIYRWGRTGPFDWAGTFLVEVGNLSVAEVLPFSLPSSSIERREGTPRRLVGDESFGLTCPHFPLLRSLSSLTGSLVRGLGEKTGQIVCP